MNVLIDIIKNEDETFISKYINQINEIDVNEQCDLIESINEEVLKKLIKCDLKLNFNAVPFHDKSIEKFKLLVEEDVIDINEQNGFGECFLLEATTFKDAKLRKELVEYLLSKGADPNVKNHEIALHHLATWDDEHNVEIARLFIQAGANIDERDDFKSSTPLHQSVVNKQYKMTEFLLSQGADPDIKNEHDKTPLDCAIKQKNQKMINILTKGKTHA